jgi:hypothetical protein
MTAFPWICIRLRNVSSDETRRATASPHRMPVYARTSQLPTIELDLRAELPHTIASSVLCSALLNAYGHSSSVDVSACGVPTGLDSDEPRWRRKMENATMLPTARNSDCQFCSVRFQKSGDAT